MTLHTLTSLPASTSNAFIAHSITFPTNVECEKITANSHRFPLTEFLGYAKLHLHFVLLTSSVDVQFNFGQIDFDFGTLDITIRMIGPPYILQDGRSLDGTLPVDDAIPRNERLPGGLGKKIKVKRLCQIRFQRSRL